MLSDSSSRKWLVMLGISLGVLMFTLDTSIVNIALPTLVDIFHTRFSTIQWVVISYLLVINALVLGAARLGDMIGKKPLYLGGLLVFTFSSLMCGLALNVGSLIAFRALQGVGAVMISALGAAIITEVFPNSERGRALGIIGAVVSLGIATGPTVGGLLIALSGWRSLFLVNVPIGIFATFIVMRNVPQESKSSSQQKFDWLGAVLMSAILMIFTIGMTNGQNQGFNDPTTIILLAIAGIGLFGFLLIESRLQQPVLNLELFNNLQFSLSLLTALLVYGVIAGWLFLAPFFLELVLHLSTEKVGLLLAVSPILTGIIAPLSGYLSDRYGTRIISFIGLLLMTVACLLISTFNAQMTELGYIWRVIPLGAGLGMFQSPNNSAILGQVPRERLGIASGLLSLSRTLGQITGLPVMASIFSVITLGIATGDVTHAPPDALVAGIQGTFQIAAVFIFIGAGLVIGLWKMEKEGKGQV